MAVHRHYSCRKGAGDPRSPDLLFHDDLPDFEGRRGWPGLVGIVRDGAGNPVGGIHRTFLLDGGSGKAPPGKKMLGSVAGGSVRLSPIPADGHLGIGEGIETALSAWAIFGIPTWAALSAGNLRDWQWPEGIRRVTIFADAGDAGMQAAATLAERLAAAGILSTIIAPLHGDDFNDDLGKGAVAAHYKVHPAVEEAPPTFESMMAQVETLSDGDAIALGRLYAQIATGNLEIFQQDKLFAAIRKQAGIGIPTSRRQVAALRKTLDAAAADHEADDVSFDDEVRQMATLYSLAEMTQAINILPNLYTRLGQMGLFRFEGVTQRSVIIEQAEGVLNLLPTVPLGGPATVANRDARSMRSFTVPWIPHDDSITPQDVQGVRGFGVADAADPLATVMERKLTRMRSKHAQTREFMEVNALKGIVRDGGGSTLYDYFAEFALSRQQVDFTLGTAATNIQAKIRDVLRKVEVELKGETMTSVLALVSPEFFDKLIGHAKVEQAYQYFSSTGAQPLREDDLDLGHETSMKLAAAITGDLRKIMAEEIKAAEDAVTAAMRQAADGLKADLRRQVTEAGMGQRLANTWRAELYPKGRKSIKAAGFVFTKAPTIIRAFDQGAVIKSKHGFWLAIPTSAAGTGARGKRMTPGLWEQMHGARLRFIYRRGAPSLLVAENMRARAGKRGGFAKGSASALRSGRGMTSVVMFILVPQVSLKKRLDVDGVAERWASALPELIVRNWRDG